MAKKSGWDAWNEKKLKKALKKVHAGYLAVAAIFLVIGLAIGGWFAASSTANDLFVLNGEKRNEVEVGGTLSYIDEGVTCISMGKDVSASVEITTNMERSEDGKTFTGNTSVEGDYYIEYKITEGRFKGLSRVRIFTVVSESVGE